jgi:tetratricopeptide (TPR) repeat protein
MNKYIPIMLKILYKITLLAICSLTLALQSCQQSKEKKVPTEEELQREKERSQAGLRLGKMLNDRDFEQAHPYLDSLHKEYPNDPQFYFCEGWAYEMQGDSLRSRAAYTRSMEIYDSLIVANGDITDMENRAYIVQILYGMDAFNRALDEIESAFSNSEPPVKYPQIYREDVFNTKELRFSEAMVDSLGEEYLNGN